MLSQPISRRNATTLCSQQPPRGLNFCTSIFAGLATSKTRSRSRIPFECLSRPRTFSTGRVQLSRSTFPSSYVRQSREISSQHRTNTLHSSTSAPEAVTLSLNLFSSARSLSPMSHTTRPTHFSSSLLFLIVCSLSLNYPLSVDSQISSHTHLANDVSPQ